MEEESFRIGGRGSSWKADETRCLIAIWGDQSVQSQLNKNHRNISVYEKIAAQLRKHGFNRTGPECRTKAKSLKRDFKRGVQLSKTSGMGAITVPFLRELQDVLGGNASVQAKRAATGNGVSFKKGETSAMAPKNTFLTSTPDAASEDLFTQGNMSCC